jgi:hypothetical protein
LSALVLFVDAGIDVDMLQNVVAIAILAALGQIGICWCFSNVLRLWASPWSWASHVYDYLIKAALEPENVVADCLKEERRLRKVARRGKFVAAQGSGKKHVALIVAVAAITLAYVGQVLILLCALGATRNLTLGELNLKTITMGPGHPPTPNDGNCLSYNVEKRTAFSTMAYSETVCVRSTRFPVDQNSYTSGRLLVRKFEDDEPLTYVLLTSGNETVVAHDYRMVKSAAILEGGVVTVHFGPEKGTLEFIRERLLVRTGGQCTVFPVTSGENRGGWQESRVDFTCDRAGRLVDEVAGAKLDTMHLTPMKSLNVSRARGVSTANVPGESLLTRVVKVDRGVPLDRAQGLALIAFAVLGAIALLWYAVREERGATTIMLQSVSANSDLCGSSVAALSNESIGDEFEQVDDGVWHRSFKLGRNLSDELPEMSGVLRGAGRAAP